MFEVLYRALLGIAYLKCSSVTAAMSVIVALVQENV
jgi:hypothetical protein